MLVRLLILSSVLWNTCFGQVLSKEQLDTAKVFTSMEDALENPDIVYKLRLKGKLDSLPSDIVKLHNLNALDISKNRFSELPEYITKLKYLQKIDISKNDFEVFPSQICRLPNMRWLIINKNYIGGFPACIGNLKNLEYIDAWSNNLSVFPNEMKELTNLKEMDLRVISLNEEQQRRLHGLLPNTTIHFSNSCNCAN